MNWLSFTALNLGAIEGDLMLSGALRLPISKRGFRFFNLSWARSLERVGETCVQLLHQRTQRKATQGAYSLVPKRLNGIQARGFPSRDIAEDDTDGGRETHRKQDHRYIGLEGNLDCAGEYIGQAQA